MEAEIMKIMDALKQKLEESAYAQESQSTIRNDWPNNEQELEEKRTADSVLKKFMEINDTIGMSFIREYDLNINYIGFPEFRCTVKVACGKNEPKRPSENAMNYLKNNVLRILKEDDNEAAQKVKIKISWFSERHEEDIAVMYWGEDLEYVYNECYCIRIIMIP